MGQQEVYALLKKHRNRWFSSKELAEKLKVSNGSVTVSLHKLRNTGAVNFRFSSKTKNSVLRKRCYSYKFKT